MSNPASQTPNPLQPIAIQAAESAGDLLGPPPVITGENPDEFVDLLDRVRADAKPIGTIEERRRARRVPPTTPCGTASACPPSPTRSWRSRSRS